MLARVYFSNARTIIPTGGESSQIRLPRYLWHTDLLTKLNAQLGTQNPDYHERERYRLAPIDLAAWGKAATHGGTVLVQNYRRMAARN
jgi:hypothetical protein